MKRGLIGHWYVDVRATTTSEDTSYDLLQHLPRRLQVGRALVVCDQPAILLSVIKKRWMKLIRDLEKQRSCTLDKRKRAVFGRELARLETCLLTSKERLAAKADALFVSAEPLPAGSYHTLYILMPIAPQDLPAYVRRVERGGLLVVYTSHWQSMHDDVLVGLA